MSDEFTDADRRFFLRERDQYTEKRLDKIEQVLEKVVENQVMLTAVEARGIEAAEAIRSLRNTQDEHKVSIATLLEKTKTLAWVNGIVTTAFVIALVAKFTDLL